MDRQTGRLSESNSVYRGLLDDVELIASKMGFMLVPVGAFESASHSGTNTTEGVESAHDSRRAMPQFIFMTGSSAFGIPTKDGILELVCMADMSIGLFWEHVYESLGLDSESASRPERSHCLFDSRDVEGLHSNVQVMLGYSRQTWSSFQGTKIQSDATLRDSLAQKVLDVQSLNSRLLDVKTVRTESPCKTIISDEEIIKEWFQLGYINFRDWAYRQGLASPQFALLAEENLFFLYCLAILDLCFLTGPEWRDILQTKPFVQLCSEDADVFLPQTESGRDLLVGVSKEHAIVIRRTIRRASESLYLDQEAQSGSAQDQIKSDFALFLKLEARCWVQRKRRPFAEALPQVLLKLQSHVRKCTQGKITARIWPQNFAQQQTDDDREWEFLLGISSSTDVQINVEQIQMLVDEFTTKLKLDQSSSSLILEVTTQESALRLLLPKGPQLVEVPHQHGHGEVKASNGKFRPASSVMNRLQWDPKHASTDYEIGYLDRFEENLMWKSLSKWEKMTEEEEFIPEHRVWKIRRKRDGFVVWNRETRSDKT